MNEDSGLVEVYGLVDTHGHTHGHQGSQPHAEEEGLAVTMNIQALSSHNIKLTIRVAGRATATAIATAMLMLPGQRS